MELSVGFYGEVRRRAVYCFQKLEKIGSRRI